MKIYMVSLLHRATIRRKKEQTSGWKYIGLWSALLHRATTKMIGLWCAFTVSKYVVLYIWTYLAITHVVVKPSVWNWSHVLHFHVLAFQSTRYCCCAWQVCTFGTESTVRLFRTRRWSSVAIWSLYLCPHSIAWLNWSVIPRVNSSFCSTQLAVALLYSRRSCLSEFRQTCLKAAV